MIVYLTRGQEITFVIQWLGSISEGSAGRRRFSSKRRRPDRHNLGNAMILSTTIKLRPRLEAQCGRLETAQSESHVATRALGSNLASSHCPGEQVGD